jgi:hypothetical protein
MSREQESNLRFQSCVLAIDKGSEHERIKIALVALHSFVFTFSSLAALVFAQASPITLPEIPASLGS